jgi:hypothetical protein
MIPEFHEGVMRKQSRLPRRFKNIRNFAAVFIMISIADNFFLPSPCLAQTKDTSLLSLASATNLTALPDASIAVVTGTGLTPPALTIRPDQPPPVVLWDELRPTIQQPLGSTGMSTITVNGAIQ